MIDKDEWLNTPEPAEDPSPEYIILGDPDKEHREAAWRIAIGLQEVDHLKPSEYLIDVANQNIAGDITSAQAKEIIDDYYKRKASNLTENRTNEADLVASRINQVLQSNGFTFSVGQYLSIHRHLFNGIYKFAGNFRDYEISKSEWVLNGESVTYGLAFRLRDTINYDIEEEKKFSFEFIEEQEFIKHITKFISNLWQIHIFGEGNTRATAVILIKYLQTFGFDYVNNDMFEKHSWYFRNALVRANYENQEKGIKPTTYYMEQFLENLIFGTKHELHNRVIHVNNIEIAKKIGRSLRTVKSLTKSLSDKGAIKRENGKRYGFWVVKI